MTYAQIQYLPALPEEITIDLEGLYATSGEEDEHEVDDMWEEMQMRAEMTAVKSNMLRKQQRMRNHHEQ